MKRFKKYKMINKILLALILVLGFSACTEKSFDQNSNLSIQSLESSELDGDSLKESIEEDKPYYKMEDVAAYIHFFNKLPNNYISKSQARKKGWIPKENNLWEVTDKAVIGGDRFGNYEKILPESSYKEADVNYEGGARGPERLVYDQDGNIFYTSDHYESFERIYWW